MKEQWCISKEKLVTLEEGSSCNGENEFVKPVERSNACKQAIQCVKLILYLELLLFVGWACYSIWQTYRIQSMEVKVTDIIREPESQSLFEEQSMHETSTIVAKRFYASEDLLTKIQDAVDEENVYLQKGSPDNHSKSFNSENAESLFAFPNDTSDSKEELNVHWVKEDNSNLSQATEDIIVPIIPFSVFSPILSMEDYEGDKELGNSESTGELVSTGDHEMNEESQQSEEDEGIAFENYMLVSLLIQNALRNTEALKDFRKEIDSKFEIKGEDSTALELQKEMDSEQENSEEKSTSMQTVDDHESATFNILNNMHQSVPEDIDEPEEGETLVKSNEQMRQSIEEFDNDSYRPSPVEERIYEEEQTTETIALDETKAEIENAEIPEVPFRDWNADILNPCLDTERFSLENESDEESDWDSLDREIYDWPSEMFWIRNCFGTPRKRFRWIRKRSINSGKAKSNELMKMYMEYLERELKGSNNAVLPLPLQQ